MTEAKVTKTIEEHPEYGRILKIEYEDGVKVYLSNKGFHIVVPNEHEAMRKAPERESGMEIVFDGDDMDIMMQAIKWYEKGVDEYLFSHSTEDKK